MEVGEILKNKFGAVIISISQLLLAKNWKKNISKHAHIGSSNSTTTTIIHLTTYIKIAIKNHKSGNSAQIRSAAGFHLFELATLLAISV